MVAPAKKLDEILGEIGEVARRIPEIRIRRLMTEAKALLASNSPENPAQIFSALGLGHSRLGNAASALEEHSKALRYEPTSDRYNNVGVALVELGRADESVEFFLKAIELADQANVRSLAVSYGNLAEAYLHLGDAAATTEAMQAAVRTAVHGDPTTLFLVGAQCAIVGEDAACIELTARAYAGLRGVPRGDTAAVGVLEATPASITERLHFMPAHQAAIGRALRLRELAAAKPAALRGDDSGTDADALEVFEQSRASIRRANAAVMG